MGCAYKKNSCHMKQSSSFLACSVQLCTNLLESLVYQIWELTITLHSAQVFFTLASFFTMNVAQGSYQAWPWFIDFYGPIVSLGSWILFGGLVVFLINIYLYKVETGRTWFRKRLA